MFDSRSPSPAGEAAPARLAPALTAGPSQLISALREFRRTGTLPREMHDGPVTADYSSQAVEATVHAALLREVQNLAAFRTVLDERGADRATIRESDAATVNAALLQTCSRAHSAGISDDDIAMAISAGDAGATWMKAPSHPWLGRIEQLTDELAKAKRSLHLQKKLLADQVERTAAAEFTVARQSEELARVEGYIGTVWNTLRAAEWELGQTFAVTRQMPQSLEDIVDPDINPGNY